jgi:TRAP-type C4-dicarboxylate transport system permease small subunit
MNHSENTPGRGARFASRVGILDRWLNSFTAMLAGAGIGALVVAIVVVVSDIAWRRIGGRSFIGAVDLTQLSVVIAASLSIPYAFSRKSHISIDLLQGWFSKAGTRMLDAAAALCSAAVMGFIFFLSWGRAVEIHKYGDVSQDLAIPMILFWSVFLAGTGLSMVLCLMKFLTVLILENAQYDK